MKAFLCIIGCLLCTFIQANSHAKACPDYPEPKNGRMICDHLLGQYCTPSCDPGYEPATLPAWAYVCNPATKRWMTYPDSYPLPWPDCIVQNLNQSTASSKSSVPSENINHVVANVTHLTNTPEKPSNTSLDYIAMKRGRSNQHPPKNTTASQNQTTPTNSDLKSVSSTLLENSSQSLSYQVIEQRQNNRTMMNKVDMQNVTYSSLGNHNIVDIGNVTITSTRDKVPPLTSQNKIPLLTSQNKVHLLKSQNKTKSNVTHIQDHLKLGNSSKNVKQTSPNGKKFEHGKFEPLPFHIGLTSTSEKVSVQKENNNSHVKTLKNKPILIDNIQKKDNVVFTTRTIVSITKDDENNTHIALVDKPDVDGENKTNLKKETTANVVSSISNGNDTNNETRLSEDGAKVTDSVSSTQTNAMQNRTNIADNNSSNVATALNETVSPFVNSGSEKNTSIANVTLASEEHGENKTIGKSYDEKKNETAYVESHTNDSIAKSSELGNTLKETNASSEINTTKEHKERVTSANETKRVTSKDETKNKSDTTSKELNSTSEKLTKQDKLENSKDKNGPEITGHEKADSATSKPKNGSELQLETHESGTALIKNEKADSNSNKKITDSTSKVQQSKNNTSNEHETSHKTQDKIAGDLKDINYEKVSEKESEVDSKNNAHIQHKQNEVENNTLSDSIAAPLVPVFSEKDLSLLRHMVSGNVLNSKRSELRHSSSSLWNKMLNLAAKRDSGTLHKPKLASRKQLASRDSSLAQFIMAHVNRNNNYKFHDKINPFLYGLKHGMPLRSKLQENNPYARQYVWNGATFVPSGEKPFSYLNSNDEGGLSSKSNYKWNGATFVPNDKSTVNSDSLPNKVYPDDITNKEIQTVLDLWNGGASKSVLEKSDFKIPDNSPISDTSNPPIIQNNQVKNQDEPTKENNAINSGTIGVPLKSDSDQLYYWDGEKYEVMTSFSNLPQGTIKYKHDGNSYEPIGQIPYDPFGGITSASITSSGATSSDITSSDVVPSGVPTLLENSNVNKGNTDATNKDSSYHDPNQYLKEKSFSTNGNSDSSILGSDSTYDSANQIKNTETIFSAYDTAKLKDNTKTAVGSLSESDSRSYYNTIEENKPPVPTPENTNVESILQAHYPSSPSTAADDHAVSHETVTTTPSTAADDHAVNHETVTTTPSPSMDKQDNIFKASVNYPTQFTVQKQEDKKPDNSKQIHLTTTVSLSPEETKSPTGKASIHKNLNSNEDKNLNTDTSELVKSDKGITHSSNILLPPPNPYAPEESTNHKIIDETLNHNLVKYKQANQNSDLDSKNNKNIVNKIISYPKANSYTNNLPKLIKHLGNPYREDAENLQMVIENDLNLKREIESLSKLYENSPGDRIINIPLTTEYDQRLSASSKLPNLDQELNNDLKDKSPDITAAEKDIEAADQYLQKEEDKQDFATPNAVVKSNEKSDGSKSKNLKAILQKSENEDSENDHEENLFNLDSSGSKIPTTNFIETLSGKEKGDLENNLQQDIMKLKSGTIRKSSDSHSDDMERPSGSLADNNFSPNPENLNENSGLYQTDSKSLDNQGVVLSVADIRDLLKLTRIAEHQSAIKKHGLANPNLSKTRVLTLFQKPAIRKLVRYIIKTRRNHNGRYLTKKNKKVYKEALSKLLSSWTKQYKGITKNKSNPLPRFMS